MRIRKEDRTWAASMMAFVFFLASIMVAFALVGCTANPAPPEDYVDITFMVEGRADPFYVEGGDTVPFRDFYLESPQVEDKILGTSSSIDITSNINVHRSVKRIDYRIRARYLLEYTTDEGEKAMKRGSTKTCLPMEESQYVRYNVESNRPIHAFFRECSPQEGEEG